MELRYQKRFNLGKGVGLNVSKSGVSTSYRTKQGSTGSIGFSIGTGIPGLSYRHNWGKGKEGLIILIFLATVSFTLVVVYNIVLFLMYLFTLIIGKIEKL